MLVKFDVFIHLLAIVLVVIENAQSPCLSLPLMMLIQGVIIVARNLSKLFVTLNWRSFET